MASTSLVKNAHSSKTHLRQENSMRGLQSKPNCAKSCNPDEIVRVLIKTSNRTGKKNAKSCSMSALASDPQDDIKLKTGDGGFILGIGICPQDRSIIESLRGVTSVEDDQVYIALNSDCKQDCGADEIEKVLVSTHNELGKDNALSCSMALPNRGNVEIKMSQGYILGIGVCSNDRAVLEKAEGIKYVENDHDVYIQPVH